MESNQSSLESKKETLFPWGRLFAMRENYEYGFFHEEGRLVSRYLDRPSDILIIGSGNGREARPICNDGHRIVCIDTVLLYLQSGKRLFAAEGCSSIRFVAADAHDIPFSRQSFDFVFFSLYSSAGNRRYNVSRDIHRLLRPNGLVLITALTSRHKPVKGYAFMDSAEELKQDVPSACFEWIEAAIDPNRPEYLCAILRAINS
jgi:ubiquinone/menaquinone biosynthesis C-methylase UbiE